MNNEYVYVHIYYINIKLCAFFTTLLKKCTVRLNKQRLVFDKSGLDSLDSFKNFFPGKMSEISPQLFPYGKTVKPRIVRPGNLEGIDIFFLPLYLKYLA